MFSLIKPRVRVAASIAAVVLIAAAGLMTAVPAYAQGPTTTPPARADLRITVRANQFKREQTMFADQTSRLADASTVAAKTQDYINAQNANGKDTSALAAALAAFNTQIATAQSSHDAAGALITAHAGFDANGAVTDLVQAAQTVVAVRKPLLDAHRTLRQAAVDLRGAIRTYRQKNSTA
jgi:hypothetical protein